MDLRLSENGSALSGLTGIARARGFIDQQIELAELDGFLAASFLEYFSGADMRSAVATAAEQLEKSYTFTRANVARLGFVLERSWLAPSGPLVQAFLDGFERLERQQGGPGLAFRDSLKWLWGTAMGALVPAVAAADAGARGRITRYIEDFRSRAQDRPRDYVIATAILFRIQPERATDLSRDLTYYILRLPVDTLTTGGLAGVVWALRHNCFTDQSDGSTPERRARFERLAPRLFQTEQFDEIVDAILANELYESVLRGLSTGASWAGDALSVTMRTIEAFSEIVRRLRERRKGKAPFEVKDEYDVQDLMYAALKPHIPDLTDEEWTPKDAGGAKRIDFVSSSAKLCIEAKMPRSAAHAREIGDELKVDIESYYVHSACDTLVVFIHDPGYYTIDSRRMERDLSGPRVIKGKHVEVIVRIRG